MVNDKPSLKRNSNYNKKSTPLNFPKLNLKHLPPIPNKNILIIIAVIILLLLMIVTVNTEDSSTNSSNIEEVEEITAKTIKLGNNSLGSVYKEGPYGNTSSNVTIAYILGVHPREQGSHRIMEEAFNDNKDNLSYCYYIYRVNVTKNPTDFSASRMNGQKLANQFIVKDAITNNFTFAVDCHYSNGAWGVERFIFTPRKNNTLSYKLGHDITDNFDWITYFTPNNPSSPGYLTSPLNDGGVGAIIYEAYTKDNNNVTLEHDKELINFIDKWDFSSFLNKTTE